MNLKSVIEKKVAKQKKDSKYLVELSRFFNRVDTLRLAVLQSSSQGLDPILSGRLAMFAKQCAAFTYVVSNNNIDIHNNL